MSGTTTFAGIEVPSTDPGLVAIVFGVHVPLGIVCAYGSAAAMLMQKGRGRHSSAGTISYWLCFFSTSATVLAIMRWAENYHLVCSWIALLRRCVARARGGPPPWTALAETSHRREIPPRSRRLRFYVDNRQATAAVAGPSAFYILLVRIRHRPATHHSHDAPASAGARTLISIGQAPHPLRWQYPVAGTFGLCS